MGLPKKLLACTAAGFLSWGVMEVGTEMQRECLQDQFGTQNVGSLSGEQVEDSGCINTLNTVGEFGVGASVAVAGLFVVGRISKHSADRSKPIEPIPA